MKDKRELMRIVRGDDGLFSIDTTGKKAGRGAYVCQNILCMEKAQKQKGLERSFKSAIPIDVYERLKAELIEIYE